jgi:hypothetical protein
LGFPMFLNFWYTFQKYSYLSLFDPL